MRVLLPDTWHFHRRNFLPLFRWLAEARVPVQIDRSRRRWWKAHGNYHAFAGTLARHLAALEALSPAALLRHRHRDIPVFDCARSELLCLLLPRPRWYRGGGGNDAASVLERALEDPADRRDLLLCMAAAQDWIEHWTALFHRDPAISHVLAYSGSYIYTRTLQEVARRENKRLFCLETFFTGREFYLEERATPLPNRSLLGDDAWYAGLALPDDANACDRVVAVAHERLARMRNKNVPAARGPVLIPPVRGAATVLVLGQVLNDFSLIETPMAEASSVALYRRLIGGILERTSCNVIYKAHPWERRRPNLGRPLTLELLREWLATLPGHQQARVRCFEPEPVTALFPQVDHVVGICSQGLIEACQAGLKPAQLGDAFFGRKGFTHDYDNPDAWLDDLVAGRLAGNLTVEEYRAFEGFLARALLLHCIPNQASGAASVGARLLHPAYVPAADESAGPAAGSATWPSLPLPVLLTEFLRHPLPWLRLLQARRRP